MSEADEIRGLSVRRWGKGGDEPGDFGHSGAVLLAAIAGTGMLAFGLRRNKMILLPAAVIGGAVSILLFGIAIAPTAEDPEQIVQNENEDDGLFDPKSEFDVERQRKKAEEREKKLSDVDKRLNSLVRDREKRKRSEQTAPRKRTNKRSETPKKDKTRDEGSPVESTNQNPFASRDLNAQASASGSSAREIERLWTSVQPGKRYEIMDDMQDVVEEGLDEADASERDYWEMFENRLNALKEFDNGKWVALDFKYGLTGWHVADMNSVAVESDEVVQIKPANEESERAILSSADMFYGPISLQAKLKVNGGSSSTPNLGLVFGSGQHDQTIAPEDCVVLFDPAFSKIRTGPFGADTRPASLSGLSPRISIAKPVYLQVNICNGYLQVFANKQLLAEKFDPAIKDVHAVSLALLGDTSGSIKVNDWQVRRWKYGRPPGKEAFVEEELMYLDEAIKDFKDIGWYHYRLALARFGCKKYLQAAESARQAEQLGIPREKMAIIYAMEQELEKNYADAALLYTQMAPGAGQEIAKAWHAWFVLTHPDPGIRSLATSRSLSDDFYSDRWVVQRIKAAIAANQGNYSLAAQMLGEILREVPVKWRGDTRKQQQQYEIGQLYFRSRSRVPFYQLLKLRIQPDQVEYVSAAAD